ncbi:MAG TPA: TlpA disulfide reductase family protein [Polyangia bacterium]|jgi:thiol-disulfide isomerase/thioredoxin|nr:TlpA disulfide reductase family protein [Polyangia bacterium]
MNRWLGSLTVAVAVLAGVGCATESETRAGGTAAHRPRAAASGGPIKVGQSMPDLSIEQLSGKTLNVGSYRGKVLLLDVWASWCVPCKQELPMLDDLAARLRGKGVEILAVSVDEQRENVDRFLNSRNKWSLTIAHDPKGQVADRLQPEKMPTSYMVDRQGVIRYVNLGFVPSDARVIERRLLDLAAAGGIGPRRD